MMRPAPRGTLALAGLAAGLAVGLVDGAWAALAAHTDLVGAVLATLLAAAVDGLLGLVGALVIEALGRCALWGRRARAHGAGQGAALLAVCGVAGLVTLAAAAATVERRNRLLAAGVACLVGLAAGVVAAALAPALGRLLSRDPELPRAPRRPGPAFVLLGLLTVVALEVVIMAAVMPLRAPLSSVRSVRNLMVVGLEAAALPAFLRWAERLRLRLSWLWVAPVALLLFGAPLVVLAVANWSSHLRFIPWTHVVPGLIILLVALGNVPFLARTLEDVPRRRWLRLAAGAVVGLLIATLVTAESETARKVTAARAGLVGPTLAAARRALDRDGDGHSRVLGGGDCDDGDVSVHPGVLDFPDDGIDQDCDGRDASVAVLKPGPYAPVPATVPAELNLLLVTIDTIRADHLGCYGYPRPTSPAIDRLAAEGGLFLNGWAHAPSTRYSMPAIATGRWPSAITWDESIWWPRLAPGVPTLAEALKAQGYLTAAFYSYDYFSPADRRGFERGVDVYRADRAVLHRAVNGPMESRGSSSREIADDAIAFFDSHGQRKFFLWLHFYDPHLSYEPHPEVPSFGTGRTDLYDGEIRFTDLHLGRVLERLRALGIWERTAVVVTGDHGEGFGEHGVTEHGFDLYAAQTKVPFIVRVPGLKPRRLSRPAGHVDLAPTLLNLTRASQHPSFLGRSLVADLAGPVAGSAGGAASSGTVSAPVVFQEVTSERGKKRGLVTADWHLIWNWTPDNTTECYDRRADPEERRDLWGRAAAGPCRGLKADLQGMVSALSLPPDMGAKVKGGVFSAGVAAPAPAKLLNAAIGDVVEVEGYTMTPGAIARVSGGDVELAILFRCKKTIGDGWRFFFHMMGPGGSFRNLDHIPVDGAMPPERWRPGQRILDRVRIPFPAGGAPGTYQIIVGLFRGGQRLPVNPPALSDGKSALRLTTIEVR